MEVWSREEIKPRLARLDEEKAEKDKRDETRLGDVLLPAGSSLQGANAAPSPSSPKTAADQEWRKPHQKQTGGEAANLDGLANPSLQKQTEGRPVDRQNTSKEILFSKKPHSIKTFKFGRPVSPCSTDISEIGPLFVSIGQGNTAFSSIIFSADPGRHL